MVTGFNVDDTKAGLTNASGVGIIAELFAKTFWMESGIK